MLEVKASEISNLDAKSQFKRPNFSFMQVSRNSSTELNFLWGPKRDGLLKNFRILVVEFESSPFPMATNKFCSVIMELIKQ